VAVQEGIVGAELLEGVDVTPDGVRRLRDDDVVEWPIDAAFLPERHDEVLVTHRLSVSRRDARGRGCEPLW